jgi:hypothetical protein
LQLIAQEWRVANFDDHQGIELNKDDARIAADILRREAAVEEALRDSDAMHRVAEALARFANIPAIIIPEEE